MKSFFKKHKVRILILLFSILFLYFLFLVYFNIDAILGKKLSLMIIPNEKELDLINNESIKIDFKIATSFNPLCVMSCNYSFKDRSYNSKIKQGFFDLKRTDFKIISLNETLNAYGFGNKIYSFDVFCKTKNSFFCKVDTTSKATSLVFIEHKPENNIINDLIFIRNNLTNSYGLLYSIINQSLELLNYQNFLDIYFNKTYTNNYNFSNEILKFKNITNDFYSLLDKTNLNLENKFVFNEDKIIELEKKISLKKDDLNLIINKFNNTIFDFVVLVNETNFYFDLFFNNFKDNLTNIYETKFLIEYLQRNFSSFEILFENKFNDLEIISTQNISNLILKSDIVLDFFKNPINNFSFVINNSMILFSDLNKTYKVYNNIINFSNFFEQIYFNLFDNILINNISRNNFCNIFKTNIFMVNNSLLEKNFISLKKGLEFYNNYNFSSNFSKINNTFYNINLNKTVDVINNTLNSFSDLLYYENKTNINRFCKLINNSIIINELSLINEFLNKTYISNSTYNNKIYTLRNRINDTISNVELFYSNPVVFDDNKILLFDNLILFNDDYKLLDEKNFFENLSSDILFNINHEISNNSIFEDINFNDLNQDLFNFAINHTIFILNEYNMSNKDIDLNQDLFLQNYLMLNSNLTKIEKYYLFNFYDKNSLIIKLNNLINSFSKPEIIDIFEDKFSDLSRQMLIIKEDLDDNLNNFYYSSYIKKEKLFVDNLTILRNILDNEKFDFLINNFKRFCCYNSNCKSCLIQNKFVFDYINSFDNNLNNELNSSINISSIYSNYSIRVKDNNNYNNNHNKLIMFVHGHSINGKASPENSLNSFYEIQKKLSYEYDVIDAGVITLREQYTDENIILDYDFDTSFRSTYYYDISLSDMLPTLIPQKTERIDIYSLRLKDMIDIAKKRVLNDNLILISHSMGGLVARRFLQIFENTPVNKLVMLGTPNYGIDGIVLRSCAIFGSNEECNDMSSSSNFIQQLNYPENINSNVDYVTIIGSGCNLEGVDSDGVIKKESVYLDFAKNYVIKGSCKNSLMHLDLVHPEIYPKIFEILVNETILN